MLGAVQVQHHLRHRPHGVGVAAHHHVGVAHEVVERDVAARHAHVHWHLVRDPAPEVQVLHRLQRRVVVAARRVHTAHAHQAEVTEHVLHVRDADLVVEHRVQLRGLRLHLVLLQNGIDLGLDDHLVEGREDLHRVPHLGLRSEGFDLLRRALLQILRPVPAEVLELVYVLVDHVPEPLDREVNRLHLVLVGEDTLEEDRVVLPALHALFE
mmetsp:Transcript_41234/g.96938  ORF Transcript_41234/g.96938 Transcript_41234/m.96938 type:complete len:211 (-) Transcript_41234:216-848(-)